MRASAASTFLPCVAIAWSLGACDANGVPEPPAPASAPAAAPPPAPVAAPVAAEAALDPAQAPAALHDATPKVPFVDPDAHPIVGVEGASAPDVPAVIVHTPDGPDRVRVLVRFAPDADRAAAQTFLAGMGARVAYRYRLLPDQIRSVNLAQSRALMNATPAQLAGLSDGAGVRVCVLDTGLNKSHPAFAGAVVAERDFVNNDNNAMDDEGHGTNVAGIIASRDATYGGVAPGASLIIGKVLGADGSGSDSGIIAALEWCTLDVAADVVNMSLGGGKYFGSCDFDPLGAAVNASSDAGVVNVIAAGNEGYTNAIGSPGCARRAITVAAVYDAPAPNVSWCLNASCSQYCTDTAIVADKRVCFSNQALKVDVAAPGSEITAPDGLTSGYSGMSGTSQATPHVAGLVARLLGQRPELGPNDVRVFLTRNAVDRGAAGYDVGFGHGRVDARATITDATAVTCTSSAQCADTSACTSDECQGGFCARRPACDDGTAATTDTCNAGACSFTPVVVDDQRTCTTDTLDACLGPRYTPNGASCHATCATALPLPIGATVSGTTSGATKNVNLACPGYAMPGADVMYRLWLRPDQPVTIALTTTANWDPAIYLLAATSATACDTTKCVGGMDVGLARQGETMARVRVPVAGWYFLVVDTYASSGVGAFTLSVTATCDPEDNGRACDDGNACTSNDVCVGGVCQGGTAPPECVVDGDCSDLDACNGVERCVSGTCQGGAAPTCDDGNVCTVDGCAPASGCTHVPVATGTSCADGTVCNGAETCVAGTCTTGVAPACDDGNVCTSDACHAVLGCQSTALADGTACDDGDVCNGVARCASGACAPEAAPSCDDGDACTIDGCHATAGCTHTPVSCDDGDPCNGVETCDAGGCTSGAPLACDDHNPCTTDTCVPGAGCIYTVVTNGSACPDDGDLCDGAESCQFGACVGSGPLVCADANPCTADACHPTAGCVFSAVANGTSCGDGDVCNGAETCQAGACAAGTALVCNDGNTCTSDVCHPTLGCTSAPVANGTTCSDGDACTGADTCQAGACTGGANVCARPSIIFAVAAASLTLPGGVVANDEDLVRFDLESATYSLYFDGSDVGLSTGIANVAFDTSGNLVMSFRASVTLAGTNVDTRDLVRFNATSLGPTTAGTFTYLFDGSDVGLTQSSEAIDALVILADGSFIMSTSGNASVGNVSSVAQDLVRFVPSALGASTAGAWSMYFDGSDVGLSQSAENVDAVSILADGSLLLSTTGNFAVTGVSGANEDVLRFVPSSLGATTAGTFSLYYDGSVRGMSDDLVAVEYRDVTP